MEIFTLKKRKYFVEAAKGYKVVTNGVVLQAAFCLPEQKADDNTCFVGFTATKKLGKAYIRNRTKRRLRALAFEVLPKIGRAKVNYVFIGRHNTIDLEFDYMQRKLLKAFEELNAQMFKTDGNDDVEKANDCND